MSSRWSGYASATPPCSAVLRDGRPVIDRNGLWTKLLAERGHRDRCTEGTSSPTPARSRDRSRRHRE